MNKDKPHYLLVPRKAVVAIVTALICNFIAVIASFQYANYAVRKNNQQWCEVVSLFNISYKELPPSTDLGQKIAAGMLKLEGGFRCPK